MLIRSFCALIVSLHWSLIVICHLGEVAKHNGKFLFDCAMCISSLLHPVIYILFPCSDGESGNSLKVPCILHMDSIKGSHTGLKNLIQRYLLTIKVNFF